MHLKKIYSVIYKIEFGFLACMTKMMLDPCNKHTFENTVPLLIKIYNYTED